MEAGSNGSGSNGKYKVGRRMNGRTRRKIEEEESSDEEEEEEEKEELPLWRCSGSTLGWVLLSSGVVGVVVGMVVAALRKSGRSSGKWPGPLGIRTK